MGPITTNFRNGDPRRWVDTGDGERRWEEAFRKLHLNEQGLVQWKLTSQNAWAGVQSILDARPNNTTGTGDRTLTLAGTQAVRGGRERQEPPVDAFTEWYEAVTFPAPFPVPPVVQVVVEEFGSPPPALTAVWQVTVHNVTASGFAFRVTCTPAQERARVHFRAEGDV